MGIIQIEGARSAEREADYIVRIARTLATKAHEGQFRDSGKPFIEHPEAVVAIMQNEWHIKNPVAIAIAYLHDTREDTDLTLEQIIEAYNHLPVGYEIAEGVRAVTDLSTDTEEQKDDKEVKKYTDTDQVIHIFKGTEFNPYVGVVKLADRLHNLRTLEYKKKTKQQKKAKETQETYAKLAYALGIIPAWRELNDLSMRYLRPADYQYMSEVFRDDPRTTPEFQEEWTRRMGLALEGVCFRSEFVKEGYYNILKKHQRKVAQGISGIHSFEEINDINAMRIVVPNRSECYRVFGMIQTQFSGMVAVDRFDDFYASPRDNGYTALQMTLNLRGVGAFEIQIVAEEDVFRNTYGVVSDINSGVPSRFPVVVSNIEGSFRFLPRGATYLDLAYDIHPDIGANSDAVIVDGVLCNLSKPIENGASVSFQISPKQRAAPAARDSDAALGLTKEIMRTQRLHSKMHTIATQGRAMMEPYLMPLGVFRLGDIAPALLEEGPIVLTRLCTHFDCGSTEELYLQVGQGRVSPEDIVTWLEQHHITKERVSATTTSVKITGDHESGALSHITEIIKEHGGNIETIDLKTTGQRGFVMYLTVTNLAGDASELRQLIEQDKRCGQALII